MDKLTKYLLKETHHQNIIRQQEIDTLKSAIKYLWINILIYLLITVVEYWLSIIGQSQALRADALNNLSGIISTGFLIVGLHEATNVNDDDIIGRHLPTKNVRSADALQMSRFRLETVFTLVTSFIIVLISFQIIITGIIGLFHLNDQGNPNLYSALGAGLATVMMLIVWLINKYTGNKLSNASLLAASKDSLGDVVTSFGTMITVLLSSFLDIPWLDSTVSVLIGFFILWQGLQIFQESTLNLIDYVDPKLEQNMKDAVAKTKGVHGILDLRSRYNGNILLVDLIIKVDPKADAMSIYHTNEKIERKLHKDFNVFDVTITIVPDPTDLK
jgi:cation diffusion facilitator family transporter